MRKFPCNGRPLALALGSIAVIGLIIVYRNRRKCQNKKKSPPTNWKAVGEVTELFCFPIKSCGVVRVKEIDCSQLGFQENLLRDRIFMVTDHEGNFVTARKYPKLVRIFPKIEGNVMKLTAAGMLDIEIRLEEILKKSRRIGNVWGQDVEVIDCGDDVSRWLSRFILKKDEGLHLFYYPSHEPTRPLRDCKKYADYEEEHVGALHDATSYMLMNESSVTELNSRLDNLVVTPMNFRPNIVIKGPPAFAEDDFQWVKIGEETIFRAVMSCTRCVFTTVDPETGVKDPNGEPLKTLKTYRILPGLEKAVMGMHLGVVAHGNVKIGDTVYIGKS